MPLQDIIGVLERYGTDEEDEVKARCDIQISEILEIAGDDAKKIREQCLHSMEKTIKGDTSKVLTEAKLQVRKQVIKAKEDSIEDAFKKAGENLRGLRKTVKYEKIMEDLITEVVDHCPSDAVIRVDPADKALTQKIIDREGLKWEIKTDITCSGGLKAVSADGRVCFDNTFESRLDKAKQFIRPDVTTILFG
jgi:V/A-type H+-transporting ATPase subunit E